MEQKRFPYKVVLKQPRTYTILGRITARGGTHDHNSVLGRDNAKIKDIKERIGQYLEGLKSNPEYLKEGAYTASLTVEQAKTLETLAEVRRVILIK